MSFLEKTENCDESGRESIKNDEDLCKKPWAGVKGLKNNPKMLQNPLKKLKNQIFPKKLKIQKNQPISSSGCPLCAL